MKEKKKKKPKKKKKKKKKGSRVGGRGEGVKRNRMDEDNQGWEQV